MPQPQCLGDWIAAQAEPFDTIDSVDLQPLMERMGDARIVLIGEASHGTSEFYRMRQRITAELIQQKDFRQICIEGDWPDAAHIDTYVRGRASQSRHDRGTFCRFPDWMWRNYEVLKFVNWLHAYNHARADASKRVALCGLDLYSLFSSMHEVLRYFQRQCDYDNLAAARAYYAKLLAYQPEAQAYAQAAAFGLEQQQEAEVLAVLNDLFKRRLHVAQGEREIAFDAEQNARVVANAEKYYRSMFKPKNASWNLRDLHMFDTLQHLLHIRKRHNGKAIVWAHNAHVGDARYTEMGCRGEHTIGQLAREAYGDAVFAIGFGTHTGTVAAADNWGEPVRIKIVRPSMEGSHEQLCHRSENENFLLPLRAAREAKIGRNKKYQRAIGVIYRPETERARHYFKADLPGQFDEYVWLEESQAVTPLANYWTPDMPSQHPFADID